MAKYIAIIDSFQNEKNKTIYAVKFIINDTVERYEITEDCEHAHLEAERWEEQNTSVG